MKRVLATVPFLILLAAGLYLNAHWADVPERFPIHWGIDGQPNGWSNKTFAGVYGVLILGAAVSGAMLFLNLTSRSLGVVPELIAIAVALVFGTTALLPIHGNPRFALMVTAIVIPITIAVAVVVAMKQRPSLPPGGRWVAGVFYYNPSDPAVLVEKRFGLGWTFNFAHPVSWVFVAAVVVVPLAVIFLLKK